MPVKQVIILYNTRFTCFNKTITKRRSLTTIYERILAEQKRLDKHILSLQEQLKAFPKGKLICASNENRCKWYLSDGKHPVYLPKSKRFLAEQLAVKKYLTLQLEDAINEKRALDFYLRHHSKDTGKAQKLLTDQSHYQELLAEYFTPSSQDHHAWMAQQIAWSGVRIFKDRPDRRTRHHGIQFAERDIRHRKAGRIRTICTLHSFEGYRK